MKKIYYLLLCCVLANVGCSKEREEAMEICFVDYGDGLVGEWYAVAYRTPRINWTNFSGVRLYFTFNEDHTFVLDGETPQPPDGKWSVVNECGYLSLRVTTGDSSHLFGYAASRDTLILSSQAQTVVAPQMVLKLVGNKLVAQP